MVFSLAACVVVECEYQYFLLTIKCLIPPDAIRDKVLEPTATRGGKTRAAAYPYPAVVRGVSRRQQKEKSSLLFHFAQQRKTEGT